MKLKLVALTSSLLFGASSAYGQVSLIDMAPASADSLQKSEIRYFSPGKGGINKVWDFTSKLGSKKSSQVMFVKDSTGIISVSEPGMIGYYSTAPDTLILFASESPLEKRMYVEEKKNRYFPLEYGDSISEPFKCEGVYCGDHPFREIGTTTTIVDAIGSIVLAENDTISNVRRIHTINSYCICMDIDSAALDTAALTQVIEERYEWFLPESQYPIIEDVTSTTYYNMDAIGSTKYAFCNLPEDWSSYYIKPLDEDTPDEPDNSFEEKAKEPDVIHYQAEIRGSTVYISYDLDADATISTIVANNVGMVFSHKQWSQKVGTGYTAQIDCGGLRPGMYILYINVNGKSYSEKIIL